jgi:2-oxoglutarate dehydrogenase E2 component (dihydrolipoamide succinyltransferase)
VLSSIAVKEGETVEVGALLGEVSEGEGQGEGKGAAPSVKGNGGADPSSAKSESPAAGSDGGGALQDVAVPELGESVTEATVGQFLKQAGDAVKADEPLVELETDKVTVEANAPADGVLESWSVKEGDTVEVGTIIAKVRPGGEAGASEQSEKKAAEAPKEQASGDSQKAGEPGGPTSPSARRAAEERGVDIAQVSGSGPKGRVTKSDVVSAADQVASQPAKAQPPAVQSKAPRDLGEREERVKMTRLRQTIARRLKEAQETAAMLTTFNEVDMSAVIAARKAHKDRFEKRHGVRLGFMGFFVKACVMALRELPEVNAEIDGDSIIYKNHYDVGVAVGTERGLVVPVVRDCDAKSMGEIEKEIGELAKKARDGNLSMNDLQGGTFSITNGGVYGSLMSTPILNPPQSAILGMHKIQERAMVVEGEIKARPMMYLALSYDHRIVDGQGAVTFLVRVKEALEDPTRLMLEV